MQEVVSSNLTSPTIFPATTGRELSRQFASKRAKKSDLRNRNSAPRDDRRCQVKTLGDPRLYTFLYAFLYAFFWGPKIRFHEGNLRLIASEALQTMYASAKTPVDARFFSRSDYDTSPLRTEDAMWSAAIGRERRESRQGWQCGKPPGSCR